MRSCETDFLAFLDSDDYADIYWVESIIKTFNANPEIAFLSGSLTFFGRNATGKAIAAIDGAIRKFLNKDANSFSTASSAFNKKILKNDYLFDEDFTASEDRELASRIKKHHQQI